MSYYGWENRETWLIASYIHADTFWAQAGTGMYIDGCDENDYAEWVENCICEVYDLSSELTKDLIAASLARVNWNQIIDSFAPENLEES